jgi:hypothetical protein
VGKVLANCYSDFDIKLESSGGSKNRNVNSSSSSSSSSSRSSSKGGKYTAESGGSVNSGAGIVPTELRCSHHCRQTLDELRDNHPCFAGDIGYYVISKIRLYRPHGEAFARAWFTCNCDNEYDYCERRRTQGEKGVLGEDREALCSRAGGLTRDTSSSVVVVASPLVVALLFTCVTLRRDFGICAMLRDS